MKACNFPICENVVFPVKVGGAASEPPWRFRPKGSLIQTGDGFYLSTCGPRRLAGGQQPRGHQTQAPKLRRSAAGAKAIPPIAVNFLYCIDVHVGWRTCLLRYKEMQVMLQVTLDKKDHIALVEPDGPLTDGDFLLVANTIDPDIETHGRLNGIVVHAHSFPGWHSASAVLSQFRFVRTHHRKVCRVALATDSIAARIAQIVARLFVQPEIRTFPYAELTKATHWVAGEAIR